MVSPNSVDHQNMIQIRIKEYWPVGINYEKFWNENYFEIPLQTLQKRAGIFFCYLKWHVWHVPTRFNDVTGL